VDLSGFGTVERSTHSDGRKLTTGSANVQLRIGRRVYRPLSRRGGSNDARVAAFGSFGGLVGGYWTVGPFDSRQSSVAVGAFVEPGATVFVTHYLALSAAAQGALQGEYDTSSFTRPTGGEEKTISRGVRVGVQAVRLFGSVFF
jgi:hypothetical protein